ncbi:MAG: TOBE domain-containing protein, partial [Thermoplasmata archaeon]|nr:TOBE domain-containing protein [Thermoplasmata archaeon]
DFRTNSLPATVLDVQFMGSYLRYMVMLETGDPVLVDLPIPHERVYAGERVMVEFDPTDTLVFERPSEGLREVLKLE